MPKPTKLPSGRWRARAYDYTDADGKRHYVSYTADTKAEARAAAIAHIPSNRASNIPYPELKLSEAYTRYIDSHTATLSPSTVREYRNAQKRDFPSLMGMKLKDITPEIVQTAVNETARTLSPKTVRDRHGLLHKVLKLYAPGIVLRTDFPERRNAAEVYVPTSDEVTKALETASSVIYVPILLASRGSLRRSEICALTAADFTDFGVTISKAMVKDENKKWVIKPPKTRAGARFCPLTKDVIDAAKTFDFSQLNPDKIEGYWQRQKEKQGFKFKFHAFRHYWASLLHANGMPDQYIAKIGGWSSVEMVQRVYGHALRDKTPEFSNQVIEIFNNEFNQLKENAKKSALQ